ncbi:MAG TPA: NAD-dependent epimerase/dehydratase family protein [Gemmatimonadaceae bacterium]
MIVVVTGSTGFIGRHLVDALLDQGAEVRALVRPETPRDRCDPRVGHWEADLLDDRSVRESPIWQGATQVYHLAGVTKGRTLDQFRAGNVIPTANVLAALAGRGGKAPRIVLVSSQAAAGPASSGDAPVRESERPAPIEAYGRSKLQAEQATLRYRNVLPITIVRPSSVYGPGDRDFLNVFRQERRRIAVRAVPRDHALSLVHVRDLVRALLVAAGQTVAVGRTYFVADERPVTWGELYDAIDRVIGHTPVGVPLPALVRDVAARGGDLVSAITGRATIVNRNKARLAHPRWWLCDSSLAREELGWKSEVPLLDGLREAYNWYVEARWLKPPNTSPRGPKQATTEESST